jgi:hypothetical protein
MKSVFKLIAKWILFENNTKINKSVLLLIFVAPSFKFFFYKLQMQRDNRILQIKMKRF